jgi:hypothetical protein
MKAKLRDENGRSGKRKRLVKCDVVMLVNAGTEYKSNQTTWKRLIIIHVLVFVCELGKAGGT